MMVLDREVDWMSSHHRPPFELEEKKLKDVGTDRVGRTRMLSSSGVIVLAVPPLLSLVITWRAWSVKV